MVELIVKKRKGLELNKKELTSIIDGFISGEIPDYQISAFLMAVYFKGMNSTETAILTDLMMRSGELIDLSQIEGIKVDKHSTGGVGDKTTLVLAPLVAAAGVPVAKMSGRGLGHTGGTLDKMESIKGLSVDMSREEFIENVKKHNIAVCGQNANLVPADKKLYALRDVTGTVNNMSLIASSIMSKKLACGADAIVLDLKVGYGAFMKTLEDAEELAKVMINIGEKMNRNVIAVITSMSEPLGYTIGNALEVKEAIDTLKGKGPKDLTDLCLELGGHMLVLGNVSKNHEEAVEKLKTLISSGKAFDKFKEFVKAQGGDVNSVENTDQLPSTKYSRTYKSEHQGYISELNALDVGLASVKLGAGRETKTSNIDFGAGIVLKKKIGDFVNKGDSLAELFSNDEGSFEKANELMTLAYKFADKKPLANPLILKTVR
ncbi:pyrimidine-nucleoside phosphorylase [Psychroserpens ponticola]|uniref:thymidine phosphorylase n=1 Tax=Psychroserpens ponticola TaxID=2932268 RepID=A0ABY7RTQ2_9FLAO|nr:pyrimidine-nucleoside phosphorylase [Psychroserpens ponticola]WCO00487.1 pyrimidine-nucleoside phosphorylase [Psychroserpens ponticola]